MDLINHIIIVNNISYRRGGRRFMIRQQVSGKKKASYFCMVSLMVCMVFGYSIPVSAAVVVTEDQTIADQFTRHTVTGITTPLPVLPDVTGFIGASYLTIGDINKDGKNEIVASPVSALIRIFQPVMVK